jgi:hypothetical protein
MPHALAANRGARYFDTAFIANDAFIARVLVLAAIALIITGGAKNGLTKKSVFLRA